MSQLFTSGGQSIGVSVSTSVLPIFFISLGYAITRGLSGTQRKHLAFMLTATLSFIKTVSFDTPLNNLSAHRTLIIFKDYQLTRWKAVNCFHLPWIYNEGVYWLGAEALEST